MANIEQLTVEKFAARLKQINISKRMAVKWSSSPYNWNALWRALEVVGQTDCLPLITNAVKPPVLIRKIRKLDGIVSFSLENLFALLFPDRELISSHHLADIDVAKLFMVTQLFRQRTDAMRAKGGIASMLTKGTEEDEKLTEDEI